MVFDKVIVEGDVPIENFCGRAWFAISLEVAVALTPPAISRLLADGVLRHLEGVPHGDAVGEKIAALGLGDIAQGIVGGAIIEAGVVGNNSFYAVLIAELLHVAAGCIDRHDAALAGGNLGFIDGALSGIVRRIKQLPISAENVIDNEAESLVDIALAVMDTASQVVHHRILKAVGGLGVNGQIIGLAAVNHREYLVS